MDFVLIKFIYSLALLLFIVQNNKSINARSTSSDETTSIPSSDSGTMSFSSESDLCDATTSKSADPMNDIYVQHTMHRIKNPQVSLPFYTEALGLTLLDTTTITMDSKFTFTMYFLGYEDPDNIPIDVEDRKLWAMSHAGAINLQHISGGDSDSNLEYHNGNAFPTGYSHIGIFATDVYEFCDRLMQFNVTFIKKPDEGIVKGNAFILDPDGYWIEIMNPYRMTLAD